jgi:Restriction endonuclease
METGTGKTYVYLRTIFELNKRYGFTKFVIVVPSIAIKEGSTSRSRSWRITSGPLRGRALRLLPLRLRQARPGAQRSPPAHTSRSSVVTVGAINKKDVNNLYKDSEKTGGEKPIDLIKATRPIVIVDEPQSVDGGLTGAGKQALDAMNPSAPCATPPRTWTSTTWSTASTRWTPTSISWSSRSRSRRQR